jgi:DNA-binding transcriptional ArsR family regulator
MDFAMSLIPCLKALADENRMRILIMLLNSDLCVGALAAHLGVSKPAVSRHLRVLRKAQEYQPLRLSGRVKSGC